METTEATQRVTARMEAVADRLGMEIPPETIEKGKNILHIARLGIKDAGGEIGFDTVSEIVSEFDSLDTDLAWRLSSRGADNIAAAALIAACRQDGYPVSMSKVVQQWRMVSGTGLAKSFSEKGVDSAKRALTREFNIEISPATADGIIRNVVPSLQKKNGESLPAGIADLAIEILEEAPASETAGITAKVLAGRSLRIATRVAGYSYTEISQKDLAGAIGVTEASIRNGASDIEDALIEEGIIHEVSVEDLNLMCPDCDNSDTSQMTGWAYRDLPVYQIRCEECDNKGTIVGFTYNQEDTRESIKSEVAEILSE